MSFDFDDEDIIPTKYVAGIREPRINNIENYTFSFAYDYISLNKSSMCFDNTEIPKEDYQELFHLKKEISQYKIAQLMGEKKMYFRFHSIDYSFKRNWVFTEFAKVLGVPGANRNDIDKLPTLYQIELYTDNTNQKAPRIVGFIGNYGIFHLVWFDYNHKIYPFTN